MQPCDSKKHGSWAQKQGSRQYAYQKQVMRVTNICVQIQTETCHEQSMCVHLEVLPKPLPLSSLQCASWPDYMTTKVNMPVSRTMQRDGQLLIEHINHM